MRDFSNIILIGLRGSGKTTVGQILSAQLGYSFIDKDEIIEKYAEKDIASIVTEHGWDYFRDLETEVLTKLTPHHAVISTGGGVVLREQNRNWLKEHGWICWLQVSPEISWPRIRDDKSRPPLLTKQDSLQEIRTVLSEREQLYRELADFSISTDERSPENTAEEIIKQYNAAFPSLPRRG